MGSGTTDDTRVRIGAEGDDLKLFSSNVERMRINSSGNVGIGNSNPATMLEVGPVSGTVGRIRLDPSTIMIGSNATGYETNIVGGPPSGTVTGTNGGQIRLGGPNRGDASVNAIEFWQNGSMRLRVANGGVYQSDNAYFFTPLLTPQAYEFGNAGSYTTGGPISLSGLPTDLIAIIANVFVTSSLNDHFNTVFRGASVPGSYKNWVDARGQQPSTKFGNLGASNSRGAVHTYFGESDGYTSNYGIWRQLTIPMFGSRNLYWNSYGATPGTQWYYVQVLAYAQGV